VMTVSSMTTSPGKVTYGSRRPDPFGFEACISQRLGERRPGSLCGEDRQVADQPGAGDGMQGAGGERHMLRVARDAEEPQGPSPRCPAHPWSFPFGCDAGDLHPRGPPGPAGRPQPDQRRATRQHSTGDTMNWCQLRVSSGDSRSAARAFHQVELRRFELLTSCMPCGLEQLLDVARCRSACRSPAATLAGRGLTSPGAWRRWLPTWLPGNSLAALIFDGPTGRRTNRWQGPEWLIH
jgi:hypothetical protein